MTIDEQDVADLGFCTALRVKFIPCQDQPTQMSFDVAGSFVEYASWIGITTDSSVDIVAVLHSRTLLLQNVLEEIFLAPKVSGLL